MDVKKKVQILRKERKAEVKRDDVMRKVEWEVMDRRERGRETSKEEQRGEKRLIGEKRKNGKNKICR